MSFLEKEINSKPYFTEKEYNQLSSEIIRCAIEVHKELGPGLLESVYEICLLRELINAGIEAKRQVPVPIIYKEELLDKEFVIDLLVENKIIVEVKAKETILKIHEFQLGTHLKLSGIKLGLLINFNVVLLKDGLRRRVNGNLNGF